LSMGFWDWYNEEKAKAEAAAAKVKAAANSAFTNLGNPVANTSSNGRGFSSGRPNGMSNDASKVRPVTKLILAKLGNSTNGTQNGQGVGSGGTNGASNLGPQVSNGDHGDASKVGAVTSLVLAKLGNLPNGTQNGRGFGSGAFNGASDGAAKIEAAGNQLADWGRSHFENLGQPEIIGRGFGSGQGAKTVTGSGTGDGQPGGKGVNAGVGPGSKAGAGTNTFVCDPLDVMQVRGDAKSNTFGNVRVNGDGSPRVHQGVDLVAPTGTPVKAVGNGKVVAVDSDPEGYGNYVILQFALNGKPYYAMYAHLSKVNDIKPEKNGDKTVKAGTVLGWTGTSGNASNMTGADQHLHFELRTANPSGAHLADRVDPLPHFQKKDMKVDN